MICRTANPTFLQLFRGAPWSHRESRHWTVLCHHLVVRSRLTRGITLVSCHIWWTSHWEKMYVETKRATARQNHQNDLCAQQIFRSAWASSQSEDSDQTGQMPRLIWVFAGCIGHFVGFVVHKLIWAMSRENLFMPYANNKGADEPHSLISAFVVHCLDSITPIVVISKIPRL